MAFKSKRAKLRMEPEAKAVLEKISKSRTESSSKIERARILLDYAEGETISAIARKLRTNRPKVERCIDKALQIGILSSLRDLPRKGRAKVITEEARAWILSLACQKPKELGYSYELWTNRLLSKYIRENCESFGRPCLKKLARGTISKILSKSEIKPHKIEYYLERRDPDFETKMAQVLHVYKEIEIFRKEGVEDGGLVPVISYDEKPGIQAIGNIAPDLPPVPGKKKYFSRDHEYIRYGTVTLMAGINLLVGKIHSIVVDRHRSREFIMFLKNLDSYYPPLLKIKIILDNHSAHISSETKEYLKSVPNRFEFIFTPKHGSWLNLIETFFSKMARTMLRKIRVDSKKELKERILKYIDEINKEPIIFKWKYKLDTIALNY